MNLIIELNACHQKVLVIFSKTNSTASERSENNRMISFNDIDRFTISSMTLFSSEWNIFFFVLLENNQNYIPVNLIMIKQVQKRFINCPETTLL